MLGKLAEAREVLFKSRGRFAASRESVGAPLLIIDDFDEALFELIVLAIRSAGNAKALLSHSWEDWVEVRLYRKGWKVAAETLTADLNIRQGCGLLKLYTTSTRKVSLAALYRNHGSNQYRGLGGHSCFAHTDKRWNNPKPP